MAADAVMPVSVVLERRAAESRWADYVWRPVGVLTAAGDDERGRLLAGGEGWAHYHGGTLDIELFRGEAEGYLTNLSQVPPKVYVVLRRNEDTDATDGGPLEFEPFLVTVCPYEAMGYSEGSEVVEGVPMPPEIVVWLRDFVARHYIETPFVKRKNKRHQDDYGGKGPHIARERGLS